MITKINSFFPNKKHYPPITTFQDSPKVISSALESDKSCFVGRFGSNELGCLGYYLYCRRNTKFLRLPYINFIKKRMRINTGFFPTENRQLDKFSELYLDAAKNIDILGVWFRKFELYLINNFMHPSELIPLKAIEPYYYENPWSYAAFLNRRILVVHPFEETIKKQFIKRLSLFRTNVWPSQCSLETVKAAQTIAGNTGGFLSWFDALEFMKDEVSKKQFDIAIVAAGSYGLPLSSFIKECLGKKVIYMGGAAQILFGIKGSRWDTNSIISSYYNENWVKPLDTDYPENYLNIEKGCYW
ncbi:MAG: hypothetical protein ACOCQ4_01625 [bacterium]